MANFTLRIELGNEAMQTAEDIVEALARVSNRVRMGDGAPIRDLNGNTVGEWSCDECLEDEDAEPEEECEDCGNTVSECDCE